MTSINPHAADLTPLQRQIVDAPPHGEIVVGGVAGSGKTLAAVYRAAQLCASTRRRNLESTVLFLCFNHDLEAYIRTLVRTLPYPFQTRIEIRRVHSWCWRYASRRFPGHRTVATDSERLALVREAIKEVRYSEGAHDVFERDPMVFLDEIRLIKGCGLVDLDDYLDLHLERTGALTEDDYRLIFGVAQAYERLLRDRRLIDFDDYAPAALDALAAKRSSARYDHVILDEAQDLTERQIALARRIARQSLLIIADQAQAIYRVAQLLDTLPGYDGYDVVLDESLRTTAQIFGHARRLLPENGPWSMPRRDGSVPVSRVFRWTEDEAAFIHTTVVDLLYEGFEPDEIAILGRTRDALKPILRSFAEGGLPIASDAGPGVEVTTIHAAKGREFRAVLVAGLVEGLLPRIMPEMDRTAVAQELALSRRQLYVAMTRSRERLWLTASEGPPSRFLAEIGLEPTAAPEGLP